MRLVVVLGVLAACHGDHPAAGDAGGDATAMHDAAPDVVDAIPRGPITVTVYGDGVDRNPGVVVPGVQVYFVEPDNTATHITTGIDGVATAQEPDNTTVWVVHRDSSNSYFIETYEGLQIGDSINAGDPTPMGPDTIAGTEYVAFPSFNDATQYGIAVSCVAGPGTTGSSPTPENFLPCPQEMTANAIVWATDSMGNFGYTTATGVDLTAHTSAATALALPAMQPGARIGVTFTNLPSTLGESDADLYALYTRGTDPTILQQVTLHEATLTDTMTGSGSIAPFGDQTRLTGNVYIGRSAYEYNYSSTIAGLQSTVTIDASQMVHPSSAWHYDSASNSITWTQQAFGVDPTVVQTSLTTNLGPSVAWRLTAPYAGAPYLPLPAPPPDLTSLIPAASDSQYKQVDLTSYAGKVYHDVLVGNVAGTASWRIGVGL